MKSLFDWLKSLLQTSESEVPSSEITNPDAPTYPVSTSTTPASVPPISLNEFSLSANDVYLLILCIWREMRGGSVDEQRGVYWVIRNRACDSLHRWPKEVGKVITQHLQFSSFNANDPNSKLFPDHNSLVYNTIVGIVDNPLDDNVAGANCYIDLPEGKEPSWAKPEKMTIKIGKTRFYKL